MWIDYGPSCLNLSDLELVGLEKQYFYKSTTGFPNQTHIAQHVGPLYTKKLLIILAETQFNLGFPDSSVGKNLPAMQETPNQFLGREDPLEKGLEKG